MRREWCGGLGEGEKGSASQVRAQEGMSRGEGGLLPALGVGPPILEAVAWIRAPGGTVSLVGRRQLLVTQ